MVQQLPCDNLLANVYFLGYELYFLVVKTICKYSLWNLRYASLKLPMSADFKTP